MARALGIRDRPHRARCSVQGAGRSAPPGDPPGWRTDAGRSSDCGDRKARNTGAIRRDRSLVGLDDAARDREGFEREPRKGAIEPDGTCPGGEPSDAGMPIRSGPRATGTRRDNGPNVPKGRSDQISGVFPGIATGSTGTGPSSKVFGPSSSFDFSGPSRTAGPGRCRCSCGRRWPSGSSSARRRHSLIGFFSRMALDEGAVHGEVPRGAPAPRTARASRR